MKKINIFCFGFGQVAKNFILNLSKTYDEMSQVEQRKQAWEEYNRSVERRELTM